MKKVLFLLLSLLVLTTTQGQKVNYSDSTTTRDTCNNVGLSLLAGYNQGYYGFAELGLAFNTFSFCEYSTSGAAFVSMEVKLNDPKTIGPKIGVWMSSMGLALGLNLIYYTNADKSSLVFRPELGIGAGRAKIVYGYNARLTKSLDAINSHQLGVAWCFRIWRAN
jgi:hypothetical protein